MFLLPSTEQCSCFVACMYLTHFHILALSPFFFLGCMSFFALFDQITYFRYIVGKSTPFSTILESFVYKLPPLLEGMLSFLLSLYIPYSFSKYIERCRAIEILMSLFICKMSSLVCVFIYSIYFCSPSPSPLVVDTSFIPMIPLTSIRLSHVYMEKKQNFYVLSFSFWLLRCR
jgi:hypothetical protein